MPTLSVGTWRDWRPPYSILGKAKETNEPVLAVLKDAVVFGVILDTDPPLRPPVRGIKGSAPMAFATARWSSFFDGVRPWTNDGVVTFKIDEIVAIAIADCEAIDQQTLDSWKPVLMERLGLKT